MQILPPDKVVIYGLTFSPDGNYIDFVRSEKNNPFDTYLYRMPVLGGTPRLAMSGGIDAVNSYSPDGTQFAFLRVRDGTSVDVLVAKPDGSNERVLANRPYLSGAAIGTAWSPDSKTVAFTNSDPSVCGDGRYIVYSAFREQKMGIWRMDADGSNPVRIADEAFAFHPRCSLDGKWVVYLRGPSFTPARVTITGMKSPDSLVQGGAAVYVAISPDGKRIMYVSSPDSPAATTEASVPPSGSKPNLLKVISFDGGAPINRLEWPVSAGAFQWAPTGVAVDYVLTKNGISNIWRQKLTGGPAKQFTNFESGLIFDFAWSNDGKQLALTRGSESSDVILISNFR